MEKKLIDVEEMAKAFFTMRETLDEFQKELEVIGTPAHQSLQVFAKLRAAIQHGQFSQGRVFKLLTKLNTEVSLMTGQHPLVNTSIAALDVAVKECWRVTRQFVSSD